MGPLLDADISLRRAWNTYAPSGTGLVLIERYLSYGGRESSQHQVFHKWAQLGLPRNPATGAVGFLKVDISIIFRGDIQVLPVVDNDERVENNLLLPTGTEQQPANYVITIYGAFNLPNGHGQGDRRFGKLPSSFVRVSFCGLSAKTAVQIRNNHPTYCEQISIVEMFPSISEIIRLEVCSGDGCFNKVMATAHLKLAEISHDGENGFLPTFGPSLLHMYGTTTSGTLATTGEDGPYHRGAMLVSLKTIVPYYQQGLRSTTVEPVSPLLPEKLWLMEDFCIFCPILEVSMLDRCISGKMSGIAITVGELPTADQGDEEFIAIMSAIKQRKLYYTGSMDVWKTRPVHGYLEFENTFPVLQLATRLPDFRFRMYRNNMVYGIVTDLEQALSELERRLENLEFNSLCDLTDDMNRAVDDAAGNILKFLDIIQYSCPNSSVENTMIKYSTELDIKQFALLKEEIEKIYQQLTKRTQRCSSTISLIQSITKSGMQSSKKDVKLMLADIKMIAESLKNLIYKASEGWPDVVVWLLSGGSRVAYYKLSIADIVFSVIPEQNGRQCGRIQSVYLKPLKCPKHTNNLATGCCCIAGKVELLLWMGLYRQIQSFEGCLPKGYKLKVDDYDMCLKTSTMMLECRVFVYRAKLNTSTGDNKDFVTAQPFVRINTLNAVKETRVQSSTLTPVWNQVLKVHKLVSATQDRLRTSPPLVMVEVLDSVQTGKSELIGRSEVVPVVDDKQDYEYAPMLQWYDLHKGQEYSGQILMSVQLCQIPETLMRSTVYSPIECTYTAPGVKDVEQEFDELESLPPNLIPKSNTYKVDIYWWGLRDVTTTRKPCVILEIDELTIKSDVVCDKKSNCNFPNGRSSQIFQAPLSEVNCPPLSIRLYDSSTFGRTLFLGTNIVKNPNKYIVSWLPQGQREASLRSMSITASNFFQVNQILYIRKDSPLSMEDIGSKISLHSVQKTKKSRWRRVFNTKEADEEKFVLLPMFSKDKNLKLAKNNSLETSEQRDWWMRYFSTLADDADEDLSSSEKIIVYGGELETQPEFSKFKDWCTTLKLYSGKKTGIPEKDEHLYCGFLKAGIAIYRWPPPKDTIAVSCTGVELNCGFFNDYPDNEPSTFLVRVYIVKGVNLVPQAFTGKLDPYVAISCGSKHLGDRTNHVKNTQNPIFGKMYEFRCTLPDDYLLTVSLFDYDAIPPDELIGSTTIDLEDRIYSKHRARVGLATEYNTIGPYKWRDCQKPSVILEDLCAKNHLDSPIFPDNATVVVNGVEYRDNDSNVRNYRSAADRKENMCLSLLHSWHTLPICGYHLVPEHVETRSLTNFGKNDLEQGKLQMWVDIFPLDTDVYIPPGVNLTPRQLEDYELRVVVWDVQGLKLAVNGKKVSDIYVRAWLDTVEQAQYTDVHYSSSSGKGRFNWRMIFPFQYHQAEKKLVRKEKGPFTEVEEHMAPVFVVQVLDSDAASQDDFLASASFNLNSMSRGVKYADKCNAAEMEKHKKINLFSIMKVRAWWPLTFTNRITGNFSAAGVIDLEMTLLPKEKAILLPVGLGREPPAALPKPNRSESPSMNPLKFVKTLNCRKQNSKVTFVGVLAAIVVALVWYLELPLLLLDLFT